jgi:hypothetical protein
MDRILNLLEREHAGLRSWAEWNRTEGVGKISFSGEEVSCNGDKRPFRIPFDFFPPIKKRYLHEYA